MKKLEDYIYYQEKDPDITVLHGDAEDILPLLPKVSLIVTDPPYGIGEHGGKNRYGPQSVSKGFKQKTYQNKGWDKERLPKSYFDLMFEKSEDQVIFGMNYYTDYLPPTKCVLVWHKKGNDKSSFADCELAWASFDISTKYFNFPWVGFGYINNSKGQKKVHPTQKPIQLMEWILRFKDGAVCDPLGGGGTTAVACKINNRPAFSIDISEEYCEVTKNRLIATSKYLLSPTIH